MPSKSPTLTSTKIELPQLTPRVDFKQFFNGLRQGFQNHIQPIFQAKTWKIFSDTIQRIVIFTCLLLFYLGFATLKRLGAFKLFPQAVRTKLTQIAQSSYRVVIQKTARESRGINRLHLIELALQNMVFKKTRSVITIGGMSIGVGAIVFLVSIGFGLQNVVINRVARLDELTQADVFVQPGSREKITDQTIATMQDLVELDKALPVIATVARVSFQNSVSDMAVYGVTSEYLSQSAIKTIRGELFDSNEIAITARPGKVAGALSQTDSGALWSLETEKPVVFQLTEGEWLKVRSNPDKTGQILGYTRRVPGEQSGVRVVGKFYQEAKSLGRSVEIDDQTYATWIKADFALWQNGCPEVQKDTCVAGKAPKLTDTGEPVIQTGFVAEIGVNAQEQTIKPVIEGQVLGVSTLATQSGEILGITEDINNPGWVEIASESAVTATQKITQVALGDVAKKQAVVNSAMLKILNIPEDMAVGSTFETSFVVVGELLNDSEAKIESLPVEYKIVGVVPSDKAPFFYVPFVDLRSLGVNNYSQLKVVSKNRDQLSGLRQKIEALGFSTRSVVDTVLQIEQFFATARVILAVLGVVALSIAALGMFNTLTISLLERTREVGLMKAMGMKSDEVQELFLTESMVMGFFGGVLGILLGYGAGKLLSLILSSLAWTQGLGAIDIAYLPWGFLVFVLGLSLLVGFGTGIYPAQRATQISALDALRYE